MTCPHCNNGKLERKEPLERLCERVGTPHRVYRCNTCGGLVTIPLSLIYRDGRD